MQLVMVIRMNSKNCNAMKKIFTKLMLLAVAATAIVSCENNYEEQTPVVELTQTVTLSADKTAVRTELIEGVPYWSKGDQIGVYVVEGESYKNYAFKNDSEEASLTTSFTGETAVANTLFVYYPYTNFNNPVTEKGVKVEILANQEPTAASFDGRTDLMIAKPVTLDEAGKQLNNLEFARVAAIVKIVLKDKTGNLAGQHVSSLTMTAATNLVGRVYLDVVNQEIFTGEGGGLYYGGAPSVTAAYTEATQYEVDGENATYVVVYPQTLAAGSKLSFEASTEGYAITKEITLPSDIELLAGKVTTLNVSLAAENVVKEEAGLALPFEDDFARFKLNASEPAITSLGDNYSAFENIYQSKEIDGAIKFGTGSKAGSITTVALNLSEPFTVILAAKCYGSDKTTVNVTVGSVTKQVTLTSTLAYYAVEFDAASKKEAVTVASSGTSNQRFHFDELQVVAGHDVVLPTLPPVLTVSTAEISGVSHEGEAKTFTYSVANPVEGTSVVITADAEWLTIADNNGTVTVTVAENTLEEVRNSTITVKYGDLTETIAIQQNAKPAEGAPTTVVDVLDRAWTGNTQTSYVSWSGKTSNSTAVYAGNSAGGYSSIQLKSKESSSGIVTTTSGGKAKKIAVVWNSETSSGRTLDIYGKNTAYSAVSDLYSSSTQGTKIGSIVCGTSTSLTIEDDYEYIGLRSNSGAMYLTEIQITWETGEGGGETPEPEPATPVLSVNPTTLSFDAAAASKTVTCTIENEVSGQNVTATESVDWLSTSVSGTTVTITATENTGAAREATVTIAYTGAESKTVTVNQAAAENTGGGETTTKTYTFTITKSDFTTKSYADNNKEHTSTATATDGTTMQVKWTSNQVYQSGGDMQWQKSNGYIYNSTDLGTINSVTVETVSGSFTKYINSTKQPTSNGSGGYFQVKTGSSAVGHTNSITVTFTK